MSYPVFEGPKSHIIKLVGTSCESCGIHWEQFWAFGGIIMHHEVWTLLIAFDSPNPARILPQRPLPADPG